MSEQSEEIYKAFGELGGTRECNFFSNDNPLNTEQAALKERFSQLPPLEQKEILGCINFNEEIYQWYCNLTDDEQRNFLKEPEKLTDTGKKIKTSFDQMNEEEKSLMAKFFNFHTNLVYPGTADEFCDEFDTIGMQAQVVLLMTVFQGLKAPMGALVNDIKIATFADGDQSGVMLPVTRPDGSEVVLYSYSYASQVTDTNTEFKFTVKADYQYKGAKATSNVVALNNEVNSTYTISLPLAKPQKITNVNVAIDSLTFNPVMHNQNGSVPQACAATRVKVQEGLVTSIGNAKAQLHSLLKI